MDTVITTFDCDLFNYCMCVCPLPRHLFKSCMCVCPLPRHLFKYCMCVCPLPRHLFKYCMCVCPLPRHLFKYCMCVCPLPRHLFKYCMCVWAPSPDTYSSTVYFVKKDLVYLLVQSYYLKSYSVPVSTNVWCPLPRHLFK